MTEVTVRIVDNERVKAQDTLQNAEKVLDLRSEYGSVVEDFNITAELWSAYLGILVTMADVTQLMVLTKVGRTKAGKYNEDNYIDQAGYSGLSNALAAHEQHLTRGEPYVRADIVPANVSGGNHD